MEKDYDEIAESIKSKIQDILNNSYLKYEIKDDCLYFEDDQIDEIESDILTENELYNLGKGILYDDEYFNGYTIFDNELIEVYGKICYFDVTRRNFNNYIKFYIEWEEYPLTN